MWNASNTSGYHLTSPAHSMDHSEAGPSMPRQIVEQNLPLPSSNKQLTVEELQSKVDKYQRKIREYEDNERMGKHMAQISGNLRENQKKASYLHQRFLDELLQMTEQCNAKGFIYGMVTETGTSLIGTSDSLRAWWKDEVMFDRIAPVQIEKYYKEHFLYANLGPDNEAKSTTDLLRELSDPTLGSILSLLMQHCDPPQRKFPFERGLQPPWWPTTQEDWWGQIGISAEGGPPYRKPHNLKKKWKVAVIVGLLKWMSPKFLSICTYVKQSRLDQRMNAKEQKFWTLALVSEAKLYYQEHPDDSAQEAAAFVRDYGSS